MWNEKRRVWKQKPLFKKGAAFLLFFIIACLCILVLPFSCNAEELPEELQNLHALSAVLMDADSGRVLEEKEGNVMRPMASTTKIMTCILALEEGNPEDEVVVSAEAARQPAVHLGMREGQSFRLGDLLYSLMLESHNDTAVAIAEYIGGSVEGFAKKMNKKAMEIGCGHAYFITPNGLDASDKMGAHSISATDLATIMSYCVLKSPKAEQFITITRTNSYSFQDLSGINSYSCQNHNSFLNMMEGALSGKTGFTGDAGYCYVGALKRDNRTFVVALLGCGWPNNKNYKWEDTRKLMEYAIENYTYKKIPVVQDFQSLAVTDGMREGIGLFQPVTMTVGVEGEEKEFLYLMKTGENLHAEISRKTSLTAPVQVGEKIGTLTYYLDEEPVKSYDLVTKEGVERISLKYVVKNLFRMYLDFSGLVYMKR